MLKKIFNYQLLMLNSSKIEHSTNKNSRKFFLYFIIIGSISGFLFNIFNFNSISGLYLIPIISVSILTQILHSENKLYELVPASSKFTVINSYVLFIVSMVLCYILSLIIGIAFIGGIFLIVFLTGGTLEESSPEAIAQSSNFIFNKGIILMILLLILITFIAITIAFIKKKKTRNFSFSLLALGIIVPMFMYKSTIEATDNNILFEFFNEVSRLPEINLILILTSIIVIISIPLSIYLSYRIYIKRPINLSK